MQCEQCGHRSNNGRAGFWRCPQCGWVNHASGPRTNQSLSHLLPAGLLSNRSKSISLLALALALVVTAPILIRRIIKPPDLSVKPVISNTSPSSAISSKLPTSGGASSQSSPSKNKPPVSPATNTSPPPSTPTPASCSKDTSYIKAAALSLDLTSPGLKQVIDPVHYYTVYGHTADQIRSQLNQCSAVSENGQTFDASTDWYINFQYLYSAPSGGLCTLNNIAVGVHVSQAMPAWQASDGDVSGLSTRWSSFIQNLTTHEQGHVNLDTQTAQTLLTGLQNFPATDCGSIVAAANAYGNSQLAALNQANINYDSQTNHGATQGAVFP